MPQGSWVGSALHAVLLWPLLRTERSWSCQHWEDVWGQYVLHSQLSLGTSGQQLLCLKTSFHFKKKKKPKYPCSPGNELLRCLFMKK